MLRSATKALNSTRLMSSLPSVQKVVLIRETGGLEVLRFEDNFPVPEISSDEILIKNKYAGINYIESYFRKGIYPAEKPYLLGREASGVVVARGDNVDKFQVGDKVAYLSGNTFAQYTKIAQDKQILKLPETTTDDHMKQYAALMVQGLTALTFVNDAYSVQKGDFVLLYAAAGGAGLAFNQLLKQKGAHTIAVASTDDKLQLARDYGAEYFINSQKDDILAKVMEYTNGEGVDAAFDSVGKDTFEITLSALKRKGTFVSFGNASGPVPPLNIGRLSPKNIKLLRPQLFAYVTGADDWERYSKEFVRLVDSDLLTAKIFGVYPLENYKDAAELMEARKTVGKLLLEIP
ncbi:LAMI_0C05930g1_1 [Lachancea mirantina]|uniref:Probable quinone oxidoreductase n=1 Tax=Lachancea mirantina TaxID=1230905 RepID=A0A1G4J3K9_9SACH|nr:LAMI_0C05930g1_1 [Lachancea mirantina]